jgi:[glutamine synthetase] adenylyltransferase / [glutamine synthetase]-adenylyl-L-tyrosine phosphorylase
VTSSFTPSSPLVLSFPPDLPDPAGARVALERFLQASGDPAGTVARLERRGPEAVGFLAWALGGSPFVAEQLVRHADWVDLLTDRRALARDRRQGDVEGEIRAALEREDPEGARDVLRRIRRREAARLALRDLRRLASVEETLRGLSELAGGLVVCALEVASRELRGEAGLRARPRRARETGFAVLAFGKLGGSELNFSSDVDLVYLHATDRGAVSKRSGALHRHAYAEALGRRLTAVLADASREGHVYRVDLRLRPEGGAGTISHSLATADAYYQKRGATWERLALIKARPVAGDLELGKALLRHVRPFVWGRPFGDAELRQVLAMKQASDRGLAARGLTRRNVKLGRGGIREIELVVQALQLGSGGASAALRSRGSLDALEALRSARLLAAADHDVLAHAYLFLRDVENKLQMAHDSQTHVVPADEAEQRLLARRLGYADGAGLSAAEDFASDLASHTDAVHRLFRERVARFSGESAR